MDEVILPTSLSQSHRLFQPPQLDGHAVEADGWRGGNPPSSASARWLASLEAASSGSDPAFFPRRAVAFLMLSKHRDEAIPLGLVWAGFEVGLALLADRRLGRAVDRPDNHARHWHIIRNICRDTAASAIWNVT